MDFYFHSTFRGSVQARRFFCSWWNYGFKQHRDLSVVSALITSPHMHALLAKLQFWQSKTVISLVDDSENISEVEYLPTHPGHTSEALPVQTVFISPKLQRCLFCQTHRCIAIFWSSPAASSTGVLSMQKSPIFVIPERQDRAVRATTRLSRSVRLFTRAFHPLAVRDIPGVTLLMGMGLFHVAYPMVSTMRVPKNIRVEYRDLRAQEGDFGAFMNGKM